MYDNVAGLKWCGQLSYEDADMLALYGKQAKTILEFGVGGSTMIFSQVCEYIVSVDTNVVWTDKVKQQLRNIGTIDRVRFDTFDTFMQRRRDTTFDLVFVDGVVYARAMFALRAWKLLNNGGRMVFHDADRPEMKQAALDVGSTYASEVESIDMIVRAANNVDTQLSCIVKSSELVKKDWSAGREMWSLNRTDDTDKFIVLEKA